MIYVIYGTPGCGFCLEAKRTLNRLELPYDYVDTSELDQVEIQTLQEIAGTTFRTVPQIFTSEGSNMDYVGGFKELKVRLSGE